METLLCFVVLFISCSVLAKKESLDCLPPAETIPQINGSLGETVLNLTMATEGLWSTSARDTTSGEDISSSFSTFLENTSNPFVWTLEIANDLPLNLRTENHDLIFTFHCTVKSITTFFTRKAILLPQQVNDQSVHNIVELSILKSSGVKSILSELYQVLNVSDTDLSLTVLDDGELNEVESFYFEMTKNGVLTLKHSLNSTEDDTFVFILRRVMSSCTEIVPLLLFVVPDPSSASTNESDHCRHQPSFKLHNCSTLNCDINVYRTEIEATFQGAITNLQPSSIYAEDSEGRQTTYIFKAGNPRNYNKLFHLHPDTGIVNTSGFNLSAHYQPFYIIVQAQVKSSPSCYDVVVLYIKVNNVLTPATNYTTRKVKSTLKRTVPSTTTTTSTLSTTDILQYISVEAQGKTSEHNTSLALKMDKQLQLFPITPIKDVRMKSRATSANGISLLLYLCFSFSALAIGR